MFERDPKTAKIGEEILPFEMWHLPEFFKQKAKREINFSPSTIEESMKELKELISNDDYLKECQIKDDILLVFLTCRKCIVERAFQHLKKYINFRMKNRTMFTTPSFDALAVFMTSGLATVLPLRCQDGCSLVYIKLGKCNSEQHPVEVIKQYYALLLFQTLRIPMTQVNGFKVIIDLDISLEVVKICSPQNMYLFLYGVLVVSPCRFKAIHIINMGGFGRLVWQISSILVPEKIKKRVLFHKSKKALLHYFPCAVLPQELGGDLKDYDMTGWLKKYSSPEETLSYEL